MYLHENSFPKIFPACIGFVPGGILSGLLIFTSGRVPIDKVRCRGRIVETAFYGAALWFLSGLKLMSPARY